MDHFLRRRLGQQRQEPRFFFGDEELPFYLFRFRVRIDIS